MDAKTNGAQAAHPISPDVEMNTINGSWGSLGLTKREVFALHATQPGVAEIVTAAGLHCRDNHTVWADAQTKVGTFNDWWGGLSNAERFALSAKVKVQEADAMLAALADESPE